MYGDLGALLFLVAGKESNEQLEIGVSIASAFPFIFGETGLLIRHIPTAGLLKAPQSREAELWVLKSGRQN